MPHWSRRAINQWTASLALIGVAVAGFAVSGPPADFSANLSMVLPESKGRAYAAPSSGQDCAELSSERESQAQDNGDPHRLEGNRIACEAAH